MCGRERSNAGVIPNQITLRDSIAGPQDKFGIGERLPRSWQGLPLFRTQNLLRRDIGWQGNGLPKYETLLIGHPGLCGPWPQFAPIPTALGRRCEGDFLAQLPHMSVSILASGTKLELSSPVGLFDISPQSGFPLRQGYDVTRDGQRFLVTSPVESPDTPITVVVNWAAGMKK